MLTIKNLRKRYGNFQALDGLNLEVADGELFGFVGPNVKPANNPISCP